MTRTRMGGGIGIMRVAVAGGAAGQGRRRREQREIQFGKDLHWFHFVFRYINIAAPPPIFTAAEPLKFSADDWELSFPTAVIRRSRRNPSIFSAAHRQGWVDVGSNTTIWVVVFLVVISNRFRSGHRTGGGGAQRQHKDARCQHVKYYHKSDFHNASCGSCSTFCHSILITPRRRNSL